MQSGFFRLFCYVENLKAVMMIIVVFSLTLTQTYLHKYWKILWKNPNGSFEMVLSVVFFETALDGSHPVGWQNRLLF